MKRLISLMLVFALLNSGCAVLMASSHPPKLDEGVLNVGMPRHAVLAELGAPVTTELEDGKRTDVINYTQGVSKGWKIGRSVFHAVGDWATLFLWELIAMPIEVMWGEKKKSVRVVYDEKDNVETVQSLRNDK